MNASYTKDAKTAVIFIQRDLHWREYGAVLLRAHIEQFVLYSNGYRSYIQPHADKKMIAQFLLDKKIDAFSYFGHEGFPAVATLDAQGWRNAMYNAYIEKYVKLGIARVDAEIIAEKQSENFGLDMVRNHSCFSLQDTSIAELFVRPGGTYYGSPNYYIADPFFDVFEKDTTLILKKYRVPRRSKQ